MEKTVKLHIEGMHCGSCEKIIEMELLDVPGIKSAKINFQTGTGDVITESNVNSEQITAAVFRAGYKGDVLNEESPEFDTQAKEDEKSDVVIEKTFVDAESPFKIKLESSVIADGEFSQENNTPIFKGKINQIKKGEFEIPQGRSDIEKAIQNIINSSKIGQIFGLFSSDSNLSVSNVKNSLPSQNIREDKEVAKIEIKEDKQKGDQNVNLILSGMHCASCALVIEKSLKKVSGVKDANVNFNAEKARVIFDSSKSGVNDLIQAVKT
ncbi:MAG: hypothetical protein ACD_19C00120G0001, partial [uncultured bacterium]